MREETVLGLGVLAAVGLGVVAKLFGGPPPPPVCDATSCPEPGSCIAGVCQCQEPNHIVGGICTPPTPCGASNCPAPEVCVGQVCTCASPNVMIGGICQPRPYAPPVLQSVSPTHGPGAGSTTFTLHGTNMQTVDGAFVGAVGLQLSHVSDTTVTAVGGAHTPGTPLVANVSVESHDAQGATHSSVLQNAYTFDAPTLTSFSPATADPAGGGTLRLHGTQLHLVTTVFLLNVSGHLVCPITSQTDVEIVAVIPAQPSGSGPTWQVWVDSPGGIQAQAPGTLTYQAGAGCNSTNCLAPRTCVNGTCTCASGCCDTTNCHAPNTCVGNVCTPPGNNCNSTTCPPPSVCVGNVCQPPSGGPLPINTLIKDPGLASYWSGRAKSYDYAHCGASSAALLKAFSGHHKQITTSNVQMQAEIGVAKANGFTEISFNYEWPTNGISTSQLLADTATAHNLCKAAGIPMTIGYTGWWVRKLIADGTLGQIRGLGEGWMYQLESIQGDPNWQAEVAHEVGLIRAVQPWPAGVQLQVSCNPPGGGNNKALLSDQQIIADIDSLLHLVVPDVLQIFAVETLAPNLATLERILAHYRP